MVHTRSVEKTMEATYIDDTNFESVDNLLRKVLEISFRLKNHSMI